MSEAEPIGAIAKRAWANIHRQAESDRRRSVVAATADFLAGRKNLKEPRRIQTPKAESGLFSKGNHEHHDS